MTIAERDLLGIVRTALTQGPTSEIQAQTTQLLAKTPSRRAVHLVSNLVDQAAAKNMLQVTSAIILRSFTAEPFVEPLRAWGAGHGLALNIRLGAFDQFEQELQPQGILQSKPEMVVLWPLLDDVAPDLARRFATFTRDSLQATLDQIVGRIESWLVACAKTSPKSKTLLMGFHLPQNLAYGIADPQTATAQRATFQNLNQSLCGLCRQFPGAYFVDLDYVLSGVGYGQSFDARMQAHARQPFSSGAIDAIARHLARICAASALPRRKCVVVDADNTLWGGVVGEDGIDGIALGSSHPGVAFVRFQEDLLSLQKRGVILAIASKNNEADVLAVLDTHASQVLKRQHFAAWRINWGDKATSIRELAAELNIGLDSMVFIDDSSFECELVKSALPEVQTLQLPQDPFALAKFMQGLDSVDILEISEEDRRRGDMYKEQAAREKARLSSASLEDYLTSLEMKLTIEPVSLQSVERVAQLTQRTNQFNLTTKRYTSADVKALLSNSKWLLYQVRLLDRFGDYGICGALFVEKGAALAIDSFLLSCRVLGRGVEEGVGFFLEKLVKATSAQKLVGSYKPTAKNGQVAGFYEKHGFVVSGNSGASGETRWEKEAGAEPVTSPAWLKMSLPTLSDENT